MSNIVSATRLAKHWGITTRMVSHYVEKGMPKAGKGKFDEDLCCQWRFNEKQREFDERTANLDKDEQDARLKRVTADIKERELAELDGELVNIEKVMVWLGRIIASARASLLVLPTKIAPRVISCRNVTEAKAILEEEIHRTLDELSHSTLKTDDLVAVEEGDARSPRDLGPTAKTKPQSVGRRKGVSVARGLGRARKVQNRKGRVPAGHDGRDHGPAE